MTYPQTSFKHTVLLPGSLLGRRRAAVLTHTISYQLDVLKQTGRYDAFKLRWHPSYDEKPKVWPIPNHLFWDSDVAKWIEGACYFLQQQYLPEIDAAVQELVEMIRSAQCPDGYLNVHYTVVEKGKRFTNLRDMHEMYNAGHLIEAALAHEAYYANDRLLEPIIRYVELLCATFGAGSGKIHGYPGHPEIELALLRLHAHTLNPRHLALARFFLTERGNPHGCNGRHYFDVEAEERGDDPARRPAFHPEPSCMWYYQAHAPITEQHTIEGHSVRAMYLLTAVADLLRTDGERHSALRQALYRLWDNMVSAKMYVTGGIGAVEQWEGFGPNHYLPQGTDDGGCCSETCAAIGVMMLANRLLQIDLDARFGDVLELCLYNSVLTSMSYDGQRFTYTNQLASSAANASKREKWFAIACCPPNILRLLGQIGGYIWDFTTNPASSTAAINVHLYVSARLTLSVGRESIRVTQESDWPWSGHVAFHVEAAINVSLKLRIPGWTNEYRLAPDCKSAKLEKGYLALPAAWLREHPHFSLSISLPRRWVTPLSPLANSITLARGPIVYCVEDIDNTWVQDHFETVFVDHATPLDEVKIKDSRSGDSFIGICLREGAYVIMDTLPAMMPFVDVKDKDESRQQARKLPDLKFIPYYFRANRGGRGQMRVGLRSWQDKV